MAVDAGHPDYDNAEGIDGLPSGGSGGGGVFPDYPGIGMDTILGVPFVVVNAVERESSAANKRDGDMYVILAGEFTHDMPRKMAVPKDDSKDPFPVMKGTKFSVLTGSFRVVNKVQAMMAARGHGEAAPFEPPFGPCMFSKVAGAKSDKARDLVGFSG